ncbi:MAG: restriction endonuclease [Candidatus Kaiserbacteria bacterium]|nr:restriction endonuclease [Candidatus Kaiserbacteria bacterium]
MHKHLIKKADGEFEPFDPAKLEHSLAHAGASSTARARILAAVVDMLHPGVTTEEIYQHAFNLLKHEEERPVAARYSMKRAVLALGPSGFPFEQFVAAILHGHGWTVRTDVTLIGRCAPHEVDVVAEKNGKRVGIEAKFHNEAGGKTDIKDALYVHARYEDLARAPLKSSRVDEGWLITNTVFTKNAIRYARCSNLTLIGWDYPTTRGLQHLIEEAGVHPLTALTTLSESEKKRLLERRIVLCKQVTTPHLLKDNGVPSDKIQDIVDEASRLCIP